MQSRALILALMASGIMLSDPSDADDNFCSRLFIYAVKPFCQLLPNGLSQCQPVGLVGPAPGCAQPGRQAFAPIPLAAPTWQMPPPLAYPFGPYPGTMPPALPPVATQPVFQATPIPFMAAAPKATTVEQSSTNAEPPAAPAPVPTVAAAPAAQPPAPETLPPVVAMAGPVQATSEAEDALAYFAFDSAELTAVGRAELDAWLARKPAAKKVILVTGHADRLGPAPYNLKLSRRRAESVKHYLADKGMAAKRIKVVAKGESEPIKRCKGGPTPETKACLAPNRRVEIDP